MENNEVLIDIESFCNIPNHPFIFAIAAVRFNALGPELEPLDALTETVAPLTRPDSRIFFTTIDIKEHRTSANIELATLRWWLDKERLPTLDELVNYNQSLPPDKALSAFTKWLNATCKVDDLNVWGHGATYDPVLVAELYRAYKGNWCPWQFRNVRDTRTLFDLHKKAIGRDVFRPDIPKRHHPVEDCWSTAVMVQRASKEIAVRCGAVL